MLFQRKALSAIGALAACYIAGVAASEVIVVTQIGKKFSASELRVRVGDTVEFRNDDPYSHNVYSLSEAKTFDLGSYPQDESRSVLFDKPGIVEIECAIHPRMYMKIKVVE